MARESGCAGHRIGQLRRTVGHTMANIPRISRNRHAPENLQSSNPSTHRAGCAPRLAAQPVVEIVGRRPGLLQGSG